LLAPSIRTPVERPWGAKIAKYSPGSKVKLVATDSKEKRRGLLSFESIKEAIIVNGSGTPFVDGWI
jgi:hypothetical protein